MQRCVRSDRSYWRTSYIVGAKGYTITEQASWYIVRIAGLTNELAVIWDHLMSALMSMAQDR